MEGGGRRSEEELGSAFPYSSLRSARSEWMEHGFESDGLPHWRGSCWLLWGRCMQDMEDMKEREMVSKRSVLEKNAQFLRVGALPGCRCRVKGF